MSTAKRSRRRQSEARAASPQHASKRIKTTKNSHVPSRTGLGFLVDEDARNGEKLEAKLTNGVPSSKTNRVDESHAIVAPDTNGQDDPDTVGGSPDNAIGISSGDEDSDDSDDDDDGEERGQFGGALAGGKALANGHLLEESSESNQQAVAGAEDKDMEDGEADAPNDLEQETEEPSFGDMLQARHPNPIDVHASFPDSAGDRQALVSTSGDRALISTSGTSLYHVLSQALKTNDKDQLESCFQITDVPSIRATIERLQSQHVAVLLQRLAERMHKRPGRASTLMTWVHWSLIAHGGYIASHPEVMKKLKSLSQVIRERANGLQPLLHLKGKLDMLSAQMELRRKTQARLRAANAEDEDDEEGVTYVEDQDDNWSDSGDDAEGMQVAGKNLDARISKPKRQTAKPKTNQSDSEDSSDDMPNGVAQQADEDSDDADEAEEEGMFDIEAEESSDNEEDGVDSDSEADSEPDEEDESDGSDDESDASGIQQPQMKSLNRKR